MQLLNFVEGPQVFDLNDPMCCLDCGTMCDLQDCPAIGTECVKCKDEDPYSFRCTCMSDQQYVPTMTITPQTKSALQEIIPGSCVSVLCGKFQNDDGLVYVTDGILHRAYIDSEDEESGLL